MNTAITLSLILIAFFVFRLVKMFLASRAEARYYQARYENILKGFSNREPTQSTDFDFSYESEDVRMAREILGIHGPYTKEMVTDRFRMVVKTVHPDKKGNNEVFQRLIKARDDLIL